MTATTTALALPGIVPATTSHAPVLSPWPAPCSIKRSNVWPPPALSTAARYMTSEFVAVTTKHVKRNRRSVALKTGLAAGATVVGALFAAVAIF